MRNRSWYLTAAALGLLPLGSVAHAASVSYYLDRTNVDSGTLVDGVRYALLTIDDDTAGSLRFNLTLLNPLTSIAGSNFGITEFAFNVLGNQNPLKDSGIVAGQWTLPSGWSANVAPPPNQLDGFGRFEAAVGTTGSNRASALTFYINNTNLTLASFAELSSNNAGQGSTFFSAHIAGFQGPNGITSGYFGGLTPVPLPPAIALLLPGLLGIFGLNRKARGGTSGL